MRWEVRPRRRRFDAVDAGYRIFAVLVSVALWAVVLSLVRTNPDRGPEWLVIMLCLVPLILGQAFFAGWSALAYWREQRWRIAAERAERAGEHATAPLRPAYPARRPESAGHPLARSNDDRDGGYDTDGPGPYGRGRRA